MNPHTALITRFYTAFAQRDAEAMAACYHPEVSFSDPAFPMLIGSEAADMWRMLIARGKDLRVEFSGVEADHHEGRAHWQAHYTFSKTGRKVHNVIDARFVFQDGLILRHVDHFSFPKWARHALGPVAGLLAYTPLLRPKVQAQAAAGLAQFRASFKR